ADLQVAAVLNPDHISCYPLELRLDPEGSIPNWPGGGWPVLERWRRAAAEAQPDDASIARMYRVAERALDRAGYRHYEIANWARHWSSSVKQRGSPTPRPNECGPPCVRSGQRILWR